MTSVNHWVQSKRHRLWFSTKTCSCYSTKTYVDSLILSSNWIWLRWETNTLKCVWCSTKTPFNVYVSQRSQIQFEDEDHAVYMSFRLVTTTLSSLRTTACDALIVPSDYSYVISSKCRNGIQLIPIGFSLKFNKHDHLIKYFNLKNVNTIKCQRISKSLAYLFKWGNGVSALFYRRFLKQ